MEIVIAGEKYDVIDVLSSNTIVNSSVCPKHKISKSSHGERKIYLTGCIDEKYRFFDDFKKEISGFVWKDNLLDYLKKAKSEYYYPTQNYRNKINMKEEYKYFTEKIKNEDELIEFKVKKSDVTHSGIYINQASGKKRDENWNLITDIALPSISRLSIIKVKLNDEIKYYFKLGYGTNEMMEKQQMEEEKNAINRVNNSKMSVTEKKAVIMARVGQGTYRRRILEEIKICPFTLVDDEHLLIASHIKPWKDSNNVEKKDPKNGFLFTPTYDKLFDMGYISFRNDKSLMVSHWLSDYNRLKLNLKDGDYIDKLPILDDKRKEYLDYHRKYVFKKLEDL